MIPRLSVRTIADLPEDYLVGLLASTALLAFIVLGLALALPSVVLGLRARI